MSCSGNGVDPKLHENEKMKFARAKFPKKSLNRKKEKMLGRKVVAHNLSI